MNFNIFLPGLEEVQLTKMEQVEDQICFHAEMPISTHAYPTCKKRIRKVHDDRMHKIILTANADLYM